MGNISVLITVIGVYLFSVIVIGWYTKRQVSTNVEDYYMANRGLNGFVLFATMLGTNMSAFVMLGMAGAAYRAGIGMYGLLMGGGVFTISLFAWVWGKRVWALGKKFGYTTPTDFVEARFNSPVLSVIVFAILVIYTLPYITTGQIGAGVAFEKFTNGAIPFWLGSLIITLIVGYYVWSGGMKGTSYTNVLQVVIFLTFLVISVFWIGIKAGGASAILQQVMDINPKAADRTIGAIYNWKKHFSQLLLFSIVIFTLPHMFIRFMSAKSSKALKSISRIYPLGIMLTWVPSVIIGFWGIALAPGLKGSAADNVLFILTGKFLPVWMFAFAVAALFSLVMSTMDAQTLTVSSMFSNDIMKTRFKVSHTESVKWGKTFVGIVLALSYFLSLVRPATVFELAAVSFTGTATLVPVLVGGLYWKRLNKQGALAAALVSLFLVPLYFSTTFFPNSNTAKAIVATIPTLGFDPIVPVLFLSLLVMVVVTLSTSVQINKEADEQFAYLERIYKSDNTKNQSPALTALSKNS